MPLTPVQISCTDAAGANATATVLIVDRDRLRRETGPSYPVTVKLTASERTAFQAVALRAKAKLQARIDKADADVIADANAPIDLTAPLDDEAP